MTYFRIQPLRPREDSQAGSFCPGKLARIKEERASWQLVECSLSKRLAALKTG
jgi:hypothetical protein